MKYCTLNFKHVYGQRDTFTNIHNKNVVELDVYIKLNIIVRSL